MLRLLPKFRPVIEVKYWYASIAILTQIIHHGLVIEVKYWYALIAILTQIIHHGLVIEVNYWYASIITLTQVLLDLTSNRYS